MLATPSLNSTATTGKVACLKSEKIGLQGLLAVALDEEAMGADSVGEVLEVAVVTAVAVGLVAVTADAEGMEEATVVLQPVAMMQPLQLSRQILLPTLLLLEANAVSSSLFAT